MYNEYNSSRYIISTIIKMWVATLFASNKWIGEKMWTATLLARYKYAGEKMLIIVKYGVYKFYFIKDEFFNIFKDYKLMENKEKGTKRPCYFCFRDRRDKEIIWFVPISTKYDKYKKIYDNKKLKVGNRPVYNFVFGNVLGKERYF